MTTITTPTKYTANNPQQVVTMYVGTTTTNDVLSCVGFATPVTVTISPTGGTARVEYSTTPTAASNPAGAIWQTWPDGDVSVTTTDVFLGRLAAIRVTSLTASTTAYEIAA